MLRFRAMSSGMYKAVAAAVLCILIPTANGTSASDNPLLGKWRQADATPPSSGHGQPFERRYFEFFPNRAFIYWSSSDSAPQIEPKRFGTYNLSGNSIKLSIDDPSSGQTTPVSGEYQFAGDFLLLGLNLPNGKVGEFHALRKCPPVSCDLSRPLPPSLQAELSAAVSRWKSK